MAISRRQCLQRLAASSLIPWPLLAAGQSPDWSPDWSSDGPPDWPPVQSSGALLIACRSDHQGQHWLSAIHPDGAAYIDVPLPARGHGMAIHPTRPQCAVFARRPGDFFTVIDLRSGQSQPPIHSPADRHFYGHGVYSHDGTLLYATENDFEAGRGCIGIYAAADGYRRIGELPSHGIGPHELVWMPDARTLAIANGGILTHPDSGRAKLNLDRMRPNLSCVDSGSGALRDQWQPPAQWYQLSVRHLDVNRHGQIAVAMQYQGSRKQHPPLIALHGGGQPSRLLSAADTIQRRLKNYCGSVRWSADGQSLAVSSPRGGLITRWQGGRGRYLDAIEQADACGLAAYPEGGFWASDGSGQLRLHRPGNAPAFASINTATRWDNHLRWWQGSGRNS